MFDVETSEALDRIALGLKSVCVDYIAEVGKFGARNNGETLRWMVKSGSSRELRKLIRNLKKSYLERTREEKYYLLREIYALKPGVHERYYYDEHEGKVLRWMQERFDRGLSVGGTATYYLKSMVVVENFYDLEPFLELEGRWYFPSTPLDAQRVTKFLMEQDNWRGLDELRPLDSWVNYSPCGINEGPFVNRKGRVLFESLGDLADIAIGYREVLRVL